MKKQGFTISELLVALGIVAVTAAMVVPMFSSIIPDKNKMKVISYYNKINEINQKLLSDKNLYPVRLKIDNDSGEVNLDSLRVGLKNLDSPIVIPTGFTEDDLKGVNKYPNLFFYALIGQTTVMPTVLDDGSIWSCPKPKDFPYTFTIDLDGDKGTNCYYDNFYCKKPDTFKFNVDEYGAVTAGDALTDAYLTNMTKNDRKADKELAKKYLKERKYLK